jgi:hypothetical protein
MTEVALLHHPTTPCAQVKSIGVEVTRASGTSIRLRYLLNADLAQIRVPPRVAQMRRDELWRHTCFEAFVTTPDAPQYVEFNFSPSTEWAIYQFDNYRHGMRGVSVSPPKIDVTSHDDALTLHAELDLAPFGFKAEQELKLGVSAVIECIDGSISYWAIKHPMPKPDFHHRESFAMLLPSN